MRAVALAATNPSVPAGHLPCMQGRQGMGASLKVCIRRPPSLQCPRLKVPWACKKLRVKREACSTQALPPQRYVGRRFEVSHWCARTGKVEAESPTSPETGLRAEPVMGLWNGCGGRLFCGRARNEVQRRVVPFASRVTPPCRKTAPPRRVAALAATQPFHKPITGSWCDSRRARDTRVLFCTRGFRVQGGS